MAENSAGEYASAVATADGCRLPISRCAGAGDSAHEPSGP